MELHYSGISDPEQCSYLPDQVSQQEHRVVSELTGPEYSELLESGWRRFGALIFRPRCAHCRECVPIRLRLSEFRPSRSQRRCLTRNRDVKVQIGSPCLDAQRLDLFDLYHAERSKTRSWPETKGDVREYYHSFINNAAPTAEFSFLVDGELIGISYAGIAGDALNAIYAFFDPREKARSLGTLNILKMVEASRDLKKTFLYLGYRVRGCASMAYKARFNPHEIFDGKAWIAGPSRAQLEERGYATRKESASKSQGATSGSSGTVQP